MQDRTNNYQINPLSISASFQRYLFPSLQAIREGMVWLIPCLMISSFALFFASVGEFFYGYRPAWVVLCYQVHSAIAEFFPYLMTATISYVLAMQWRLARPPAALLMIAFLVIISQVLPSEKTVLTFHIILAIITPLYAIPMLAYLLRFDGLKLTQTETAGQIVKESLNMVLPAIVTATVVLAINYSLVTAIVEVEFLSLLSVDYANDPTLFGITFAALNSTLWFMGVHGYYALLPLVDLLQEAINLNYSTMLAGGAGQYHMNLSFMGAFVFIGGSGATFSLVLALLLFAQQRSLKLIAIASIPIGLLNINEILLFGLPIIFNPRLFLPFLLVPIANVVVSMLAVSFGWVASPSVFVPFNSPIFLNAWMATDGDFSAVVLQLINIFVGVLLYLPAVRALNQSKNRGDIRLSAFDTTYARRQEEAKFLMDDPIAQATQREKKAVQVEQELEQISQRDFCLEYQPQISSVTKKVVGCEALIRSVDKSGHLQFPNTFLPWLEEAGLMKDVDLWVFKQVVKDIKEMQSHGIFIPISINVTPETLVDAEYLNQLERIIKPCARFIHIEITEETLLADELLLAAAFDRLHQLGAKVHIDDFGTGYSSLSYLNQFDVDVLKVDRSFVLALDNEKGQKVFSSIMSIARQLDLEVVVEGVETEQQRSHIPNDDSVAIQGWYYAKSLSLKAFVRYVLK
ncbi:PTS sugar transporter subunit IIC/EAL domain-containing protein [Vibrio sinaloensis]|uniref:PTS sugar transporter subunit IIC/EAL domain-containing protein n=1 Tax=Photobacterium sp. (strain ATCC 43367) TaxID=379097 RepID=UPI0035E61D89